MKDYRDDVHVLDLILKYTDRFGSLPIYFEDVKPFLDYFINPENLIRELEKKVDHQNISISNIRKHINVQKIIYYFSKSITLTKKKIMILGWIQMYNKSLALGIDLDEREMQYGDDYVLLAVVTLLEEYYRNHQKHLLYDCLLLLEYALEKSKYNFYFKIVMIRIYLELNGYQEALRLYDSLEIKQVQHESLSYFIF